MLEYLFFHESVAHEFQAVLDSHGVEYWCEKEPIQNAFVILIEEPEDKLWDKVDEQYDSLAEKDQAIMESGEALGENPPTAGVYIQLKGGRQTITQIDAELLNKVLSVITADELNTLIDAVARSVESPDDAVIY